MSAFGVLPLDTTFKLGLRIDSDSIMLRVPESGWVNSLGDLSKSGLCGQHTGLRGTKGLLGTVPGWTN